MSRAALILECSYFVHCCNKGQWPNWMKLNFPIFRPSGPLSNRGAPSGLRRTHILQRTAGKMFHQWAEVRKGKLTSSLLMKDCSINEWMNQSINPFACTECGDSLPFSGASSIPPYCTLFLPFLSADDSSILPHFIQASISWSTFWSCFQIHIQYSFGNPIFFHSLYMSKAT